MAQHRTAHRLAQRLTRAALLSGLLLGCNTPGDTADAQAKKGDAPPSAGDENSKIGATATKTGRVCTKNQGPMKVTNYLGIVDVDGALKVGIRTETQPPKELADTPRPLVLLTDDGKESRIHMWYPGMERGDLAINETAYDPKDPELLYMLAPKIYGECEEWPIVRALLLPPPDMEFGGGMMKAMGIEGVE